MLLFLHGQDTFRLQQKLKEIEEQYRKVHASALNLEKLNALQITFQEFWDKLNQQSMFVQKKLFFLENVFSSEPFKKQFLKQADEIVESDNIIVLIEKQEVKKTNKLFKFLEKNVKSQQFALLTGQKLKNWAEQELASLGASIEPLALQKLIERAGKDTWHLANEIKKLASYSQNIRPADIDLFIKPKLETKVFATIDALAEGNKKRALQLLQNHLKEGDSPFYLLSMIAYQFRNLLLVKSGKTSGLHPFVLRKTTALAQRFSFEQLKRIFDKILQTDLNIKTGRMLPEQGLEMLIAEI